MTQIKNKKGRKKSDNPKKTWLKVRVTDEMALMLKEANKSQMINDGLAILMPTLGQKWDGEKWLPWEHEGTAANLVAHKAICYAIELQMDIWQRDREDFSAENAELLQLLRSQKNELELHSTFRIKPK
jgi:hypothetical protein